MNVSQYEYIVEQVVEKAFVKFIPQIIEAVIKELEKSKSAKSQTVQVKNG